MKKLKLFPVILTAAITSLITIFIAARYQHQLPFVVSEQKLPVNYTSFNNTGMVHSSAPVDFQPAAEASVQAVVHVKTETKARAFTAYDPNDFFSQFFGPRQYYMPPQMGSGSGVVISPDGYIVTNYHVVSEAEKVTVTFNNQFTAEAELVGKDPSTDIAVLKVSEKDLPYMEYGNSDDVKLGQWVLAVGYPLTLDATVTAGIVSAKSRSIGINKSQSSSAIESFIQTDAAVNPGNSGGALVNTNGQLVGINSAIASPTGSYAGYSYAIPANIVKKVANDLINYGSVQRAYLGIEFINQKAATPEQLKALGIDRSAGIYVYAVPENGGAYKSGIRKGDYIIQINGATVQSEPEMLEQVARFKPGDNINVTYLRDGKTKTAMVELKNIQGNTSIIKGTDGIILLGARFRPVSNEEKRKYGIENGVVVTDIQNGALARQTAIKKGFVIMNVNDAQVNSSDDIAKEFAGKSSVQIGGFYPGNNQARYYYVLRNLDQIQGNQH